MSFEKPTSFGCTAADLLTRIKGQHSLTFTLGYLETRQTPVTVIDCGSAHCSGGGRPGWPLTWKSRVLSSSQGAES